MSVATVLRVPVARSWGRLVERALPLLRRHGVALGVVLAASAVAQAAMLEQQPHIWTGGDSGSYLLAARNITASVQIFDVNRTPGYPAFLALVLALAHTVNDTSLTAVTLSQALLMIIAAVELYVLLYRLTHRRWVACLTASLIAGDLYIADWERVVRVEALSYWVAVTLLLVLAWYLRTQGRAALIWLVVTTVIAIMVRPNYIFFPAIIFGLLAFRALRSGSLRAQWKHLGLGLSVTYALVLVYMTGYSMTNGTFGLTTVTNINQFGKVLEYRMYDESDDPKYARLRADIDAYAQPRGSGALEPYAFIADTPVRHAAQSYDIVTLGAFASAIIRQHPLEYAKKTIPDAKAVWHAPTGDLKYYAPISSRPSWISALLKIGDFEQTSLDLLPWLLVIVAVGAWWNPRRDATFMLLVMLALAATNIVMIAFGSYGEYFRLRSPMDFAVIVSAVVVGIDLIARATHKKLDLVPL